MNRFITLDLETGGIDTDKSLLTAYFAVVDQDLNVLGELELTVKPNDGIYKVTARAMEVNKIDLVEHDTVAIPEREACGQLFEFLKLHSEVGANKLVPIGQNVKFDIDFVWEHLVSRNTWEMFCSYRVIDTATIGSFLKVAGLIPEEVSGSLGSLCKFFGVDQQAAHTAREDALVTLEVLRYMQVLVRRGLGDYK